MDALQKQLAADPHNAELTEKIAHCTAVIDAMDAYNMDTQIKGAQRHGLSRRYLDKAGGRAFGR